MNDFLSKIEKLKEESEKYLNDLKKDKKNYGIKMMELEIFINGKLEEMRNKEVSQREEEIRKFNEKYDNERTLEKYVDFDEEINRVEKINLNFKEQFYVE